MTALQPITERTRIVGRRSRASRLFLLIAPLLYAAYALLTPPFQTFDENQHLYRAWQISSFQLTGERRGLQSGGELPPGLGSATLQEIGSLMPQGERRAVVRPFSKIFSRNSQSGKNRPAVFYNFYGAVLYPPISYIPQTAAVWIGEATDLSVEWTLRLGRLMNAALCIGLIWWALTLIPYGGGIMLIIAILPPTAAGAASFSQDGMIIGASFLITGAALKVAAERRWSVRNTILVGVAGVIVTIAKIVYLPLVIVSVLPKPQRISWCRWTSVPLLAGLVASVLLFAWMRVNAQAVIPTMRPWVPTIPEQVSWSLAHPGDFSLLIGRTYLLWLPKAWARLYEFGDSTVPVVWTAAVSGTLAIFAAMIRGDSHDLPTSRRIWMLLVFTAVALLIATAMFLTLAPRGAVAIEGIQSRYFLPVLPLAAIALMRRSETESPLLMKAALTLALISHGAALSTIATTFYTF